MDESQRELNLEKQHDELELLQAVYPDLLELIDEKNFKIRLYNTFDESPLVLTIRYAEDYPSAGPPSFELFAEWLSDDAISEYVSHMLDLYIENDNDVIVYIWISYLQEEITSDSFLDERKRSRLGHSYQIKSESPSLSPQAESYEYIEEDSDDDLPLSKAEQNKMNIDRFQHIKIFSSEDFVDRKSIFRSHCAEVHSIEEALYVRDTLMMTRPMDKATHNMWAYRIYNKDTNIWYEDNDDDGEALAGGKMAHLLSILEVENVFVMVSRWFGGILLGPDRFKDINNMTRKILDDHGYITEKHKKKRK